MNKDREDNIPELSDQDLEQAAGGVPSHGVHFYFRCPNCGKSSRLGESTRDILMPASAQPE